MAAYKKGQQEGNNNILTSFYPTVLIYSLCCYTFDEYLLNPEAVLTIMLSLVKLFLRHFIDTRQLIYLHCKNRVWDCYVAMSNEERLQVASLSADDAWIEITSLFCRFYVSQGKTTVPSCWYQFHGQEPSLEYVVALTQIYDRIVGVLLLQLVLT